MRFVNELVIVAMETLGILLVSAGLGFLAAEKIGWVAVAVSGAVLIAAAALSARQQRPPKQTPETRR